VSADAHEADVASIQLDSANPRKFPGDAFSFRAAELIDLRMPRGWSRCC